MAALVLAGVPLACASAGSGAQDRDGEGGPSAAIAPLAASAGVHVTAEPAVLRELRNAARAARPAVPPPGRGECWPGDVEDNPCPRCGVRRRSCFDDGSWSDWGRCAEQGPCELGDRFPVTCADGTPTERRCTSRCAWGEPEIPCAAPPAVAGVTPSAGGT